MAKLKFTTTGNVGALKKFIATAERKGKSTGPGTPGEAMGRLGKSIQLRILRQYDATASRKNANKRNDRLRKAIEVKGPFIGASDADVVIRVAQNLPSYARFVEKGIKPSHREQTYQVIGAQSRDAGGRFASDGLTGSSVTSNFRGGASILTPDSYKGFKGPAGIKLLPRKKAELNRLKRKITIEFVHPGFSGHYFLRAGVIYALEKTGKFMSAELQKMFNTISAESKLPPNGV